MTRYAPRTVRSSWLVNPIRASARNTSTAPIQPTDDVTCAVNVKRRRAGANAMSDITVACTCSSRIRAAHIPRTIQRHVS